MSFGRLRFLTFVAVAVGSTALGAGVGCGPKDSSDPSVDDDVLLEQAVSAESDVDATATALITLQVMNQQGTAASLYKPLGCLTEEHANMRAIYTFSNCTGPYDVGPINGKFIISGEGDAGSVTVRLQSDGLKIGTTTLAIDVTTTSAVMGRKRVTTVSGSLVGTGADGATLFTRTVEKSVISKIADNCVDISGHSGGSVGAATLDVEYATGFQRCGRCPAAGSHLKVTTNGRVRVVSADVLCAARK